jgi:hypothetical protein
VHKIRRESSPACAFTARVCRRRMDKRAVGFVTGECRTYLIGAPPRATGRGSGVRAAARAASPAARAHLRIPGAPARSQAARLVRHMAWSTFH